MGRCGDWDTLTANLRKQGVEVRFKHKGRTDGIQGVVFGENGYSFNGSKIDRQFSYSKIAAALNRNSPQERQAQSFRQGISGFRRWRGAYQRFIGAAGPHPIILHRDSGGSRVPPADAAEEEKEEQQGIQNLTTT